MTSSWDFTAKLLSTADPTTDAAGRWQLEFPDGRNFVWGGFYTGPIAMTPDEFAEITRRLLGMSIDEVTVAAGRELVPYVSDGTPVPTMVLHSATPVLRSLQADLSDAMCGRVPSDVAAYVETRSVLLAGPGEVVVGRTATWRTAAQLADVEAIEIPGIENYYLSEAILRLADTGPSPELDKLAGALRARPQTVVRLYALDLEMQVVLLHLRRLAGISELRVDANSPEVGGYWNTKAPLHPEIDAALALDVDGSPHERLDAETALSPLATRLGISVTRLPGYTVPMVEGDAVAVRRLLAAADLLRARYGIVRGCLKPSGGGGGARIVPGIDLADRAALERLAVAVAATRETYVLEAHLNYRTSAIPGRRLLLAPSVHVRNGHLAEGLTLQFTSGTSWQGNILVDRFSAESVGISLDQYGAITGMLSDLHTGFARNGLVMATAGFDFAIGTVGGDFHDEVFVALQDPNLSSHGAEYLRLFLDQVRADGGPRYGATKVVCPTPGSTLPVLRAVDMPTTRGRRFAVLSAVPGRWGMIAVAAESPAAAAEEIAESEKDLVGRCLLVEAPQR